MLPPAPAGPRADPRAAAAPPRRVRARRRRPRRGEVAGRSSATADFDRLGLPADDARRRTDPRREPAVGGGSRCCTTTLLPGLLETTARNVGRGTRRLGDLRDRRRCSSRRPSGSRRRSSASTGVPTTPTWTSCWPPCPSQPLTLGGRAGRRPGACRLVGRRPRRRRGPTPSRWSARSPACCGVDVEVVPGAPRARGTPAGAPQLRGRRRGGRPRRRAAPRACARRTASRPAPARWRSTSTR